MTTSCLEGKSLAEALDRIVAEDAVRFRSYFFSSRQPVCPNLLAICRRHQSACQVYCATFSAAQYTAGQENDTSGLELPGHFDFSTGRLLHQTHEIYRHSRWQMGWYGLFAVQNLWKTAEKIKTEYISTDGEHALNLSHMDREITLYALERSNHLSAMRRAQKVADDVLRNDSYPKFLQVAKPDENPIRQRVIKLNHLSAMRRAQKVADDVLRNDSYPKFLQVAKPAQSSQWPVLGI
ncbi:hypothetical protein LZ554_006645 [Drepanopeziza brunnea f. sp. 'monogermtubi']|nr:hypothetical protein LZ554_006645 [Drepanopeziza brunnea f. sp. 'monogermtubi']